MALFGPLEVILIVCLGVSSAQPTTDDIRKVSESIWEADNNRIDGDDVQYDINGPRLFTYVNETRFTGTYARLIDLMDNYVPEVEVAETCGTECENEVNAFLDEIISTRPILVLHNWLFGYGLAAQTVPEFKEQLRQYLFYPYSRSGGPLGSSGFEHVFLGEINRGAVSGFHNWVQAYFEEKSGDFRYTAYIRSCPNEVIAFNFSYLTYNKPISSMFIRTSPEVEVALYTLCLMTRVGTGCPVSRDGVNLAMTVWDMTNLPKTIGTAYPNC